MRGFLMFWFTIAAFCTEEVQAWTTQKGIDKITDNSNFQIYQHSNERVWHGKRADLTIELYCGSGDRSLRIDHPWIVGTDQGPIMDVTMRFDKEAPFNVLGFPFGDGKSFTLKEDSTAPNSSKSGLTSDRLIGKLLNHKRVVVQYSDFNNESFTAEFALLGFESQYNKALKCVKSKGVK